MLKWSRNKLRNTLVILAVAILGFLMVNSSCFMHSHVASDGTIYAHSHPYNKADDPGPIKKHSHSNTLLSLLDNLALFFFLGCFFASLLNSKYASKKSFANSQLSVSQFSTQVLGRAPPFIL